MSGWFDIGVNLTDKRLDTDLVVNNALKVGVNRMAITGTDVEGSEEAQRIAARFPGTLYSTAGVHPHYAKDVSANYLEKLQALAASPNVVAIGECGLDFNRNFSPASDQLTVFEQQLELACELNMPVFLHERDAFEQQIQLLTKYLPNLPGAVVHCFTGNQGQMSKYLDLGLYIGITGWLCDPKRGEDLRHAASILTLDKVLLETDAPYLMPKSLKTKSRNNEPANLPHIAEELAKIMAVELSILQQHSYANSCKLFQLKL